MPEKRYELSETHARLIESKRKIPADTAVEMGLVSYGKDEIAFEYRRGEKCEFRKIRSARYGQDGSIEKSFRIEPSGVKLFPFNVDSLAEWSRPQDVLTITEGEFDACAARASGEVFVISVPNGANRDKVGTEAIDPLNDGGFAWLWDGPRVLPQINCFEKIILAVDNDEKGLILREELAVRLGKQRCWWPAYQEGCKDLNDVLVKFGEDGVQEALKGATRLVKDKLVSFRDLPESRIVTEYSTGWKKSPTSSMDQFLRINIPELMVIVGRPGSGKALALDTEVPTPGGFTTMGQIGVGDVVYSETGHECRVTRVSDVMCGRPCYRLTLDDGTEVIADAEHQWLTWSRSARKSAYYQTKGSRIRLAGDWRDQRHKCKTPSVVTTEEISKTLVRARSGGFNHSIQLAAPIEGMSSLLPIAPYTLGAWLGDGTSENGCITAFDQEVREELVANGEALTCQPSAAHRYNITGLKAALRPLGLLFNKHIPQVYQRAKFADRLALLQGLMDTDGFCCKKSRRCELVSTNYRLANDALDLIRGLGIKATMRSGKAKLRGRVVSDKYRICFTTGEFPVFRLPRKLARQGVGRTLRTNHRMIVACERVASVPVRCIQVDSPSHLFLATRALVPTHNSTWSLTLGARLAEMHGMRGAILQFEDQPRRNYQELVQFRLRQTGKYATETPGYKWPPSDEDRARAEIWVDENFRTVKPSGLTEDEDDYTFAWLRDAIWEAVKIHGAMWVLVDPWSEIEHVWSVNDSETRYTNEALRQMKRMARQYEILLIIVVHPTKQAGMQKELADMSLYDTSGSASWKNKADHGVIVYREEGAGEDVLIKIDKCKNHRTMGVPGIVRMQYLKDSCDFRYIGEEGKIDTVPEPKALLPRFGPPQVKYGAVDRE